MVPTTKLTLLAVSKDEWDTKEGTSKSMKNALHVSEKAPLELKRRRSTKKIKPIALAIVELHLYECIRPLISQ